MSLTTAVSNRSDDAHEAASPAAPRSSARPPQGRQTAVSMRWIVTVASVLVIAAAVVGMTVVHESQARRALLHEIETRLLVEARNLALSSTDPLLADFPELALHPLMKAMKSRHPDLAMVLVLDHSGVIQGDPDARRLGTKFEDASLQPRTTGLALEPNESLSSDAHVLVATAPVAHRNGGRIGTAIVGLRLDYLDKMLAAGRPQLMIALAVVVALGALVTFLLMSVLLRPVGALKAGLERIGRGDLRTPLRLKDKTEIGQIAEAVNDMTAGLVRAQAEVLERERVSHEVDLARQIQSSLLPTQRLEAGEFVVEGSQKAADDVGGDFYDFFELPDGTIGVAVADVAGKGLAGCLVLSMVSALLRAYRHSHRSPSELLGQLDERLCETLPAGSFVTMLYGVLDPVSGTFTYASAGHGPVLWYHAERNKVEWLKSSGVPLGAVRGGAGRKALTEASFEVERGDLLVQFTDGVNEALDGKREQFGFERMARAVEGAAHHGCSAVIAGLNQSVEEWTAGSARSDDETLLVVSREGKVAAPRKPDLKLVPPPATESPSKRGPVEPRSAPVLEPRSMPAPVAARAAPTEPPSRRPAPGNGQGLEGRDEPAGAGPRESTQVPPRLDVTALPKASPASDASAPLDLEFGPPRIWGTASTTDRPLPPPPSASGIVSSHAALTPPVEGRADESATQKRSTDEAGESFGMLEGLENDRSSIALPRPKPPKPRSAEPPMSIVKREGPTAAVPPPRPAAPSPEVPKAAPRQGGAANEPPHAEVMRVLEEARARGRHLSLKAAFQSLVSLRTWTAALYPPGTISDNRFQLLSTALYEACANIVEHGCALDPNQVFEVYWLPVADVTTQPTWLESGFPGESAPGASTRAPGSSECSFVIRDHGIPFGADNWKATDFSDPEVWKRGRGFGMDIIKRVMKRVVYHPGTPEGNLTLMEFDSNEVRDSSGEQRHVR